MLAPLLHHLHSPHQAVTMGWGRGGSERGPKIQDLEWGEAASGMGRHLRAGVTPSHLHIYYKLWPLKVTRLSTTH